MYAQSSRTKYWQSIIPETTYMFMFVCVTGLKLHWHFCKTCRIMFTLYVYELTSLWGGKGDGGEGKKADKPVTTVQDCVSTFVSETSLDIFKETSGEFTVMFMATKSGILSQNMVFSYPNRVFFVLNTTTVRAQHRRNIKGENWNIHCQHLFWPLCRNHFNRWSIYWGQLLMRAFFFPLCSEWRHCSSAILCDLNVNQEALVFPWSWVRHMASAVVPLTRRGLRGGLAVQ